MNIYRENYAGVENYAECHYYIHRITWFWVSLCWVSIWWVFIYLVKNYWASMCCVIVASVIMLSVRILSVIMLKVIRLNVVAPFLGFNTAISRWHILKRPPWSNLQGHLEWGKPKVENVLVWLNLIDLNIVLFFTFVF